MTRGRSYSRRQQVGDGDRLLDALRRLGRRIRGHQDVPKTLVYELCRYRNDLAAKDGDPSQSGGGADQGPSAELRPDQRDDQSLPPYDVLDPLLELYVEDDATAETMIASGHDPETRAPNHPIGRPQ